MYKHFQFKTVSIIHFKNLLLIHKFILHLIITLKQWRRVSLQSGEHGVSWTLILGGAKPEF